MENILKKIIDKKKEKIKIYKKKNSESEIFKNIKKINNFIDFKKEIEKRNLKKKTSIINFQVESISKSCTVQIYCHPCLVSAPSVFCMMVFVPS